MPVIARFFGITIKMYLRQKEHLYDMWETQNFTSLKFEGGASYGSQSAKCIDD